MSNNLNAGLSEQVKFVNGLLSTTPSSTTPTRISLKNYERLTIVITCKNATTVTGSAITVKQSTAVAGTSEKAVSFTSAKRNIDLGAGDTLSAFTVSSDTFTTDSTNSKNLMYVIEITPDMLDVEGGFDVVRVGTGDATATTVSVLYILSGPKFSTVPTTLTD